MRRGLFWASGAAWLALAVLLCFREVAHNPDLAWHIGFGEAWLESPSWTLEDTCTYPARGHAYVDVHWLYQVGVALVARAGGVRGVVVMTAVFVMAAWALALIPGGLLRRRTPAAWWLALIFLMGMEWRLTARPEVVSFCLITFFLSVLLYGSKRSPRWAWSLVPAQALWANCQGLFALGPLLIGATVAGELAETALRGWRRHPPAGARMRRWWSRRGRRLVLILGAAVVACLVNPYGWRGALFPLALVDRVVEGGSSLRESIAEFAPPLRAGVLPPAVWWATIIAMVSSAATFLVRGRRRGWLRNALIYAAFLFLALNAIRNVAVFMLVAALVSVDNTRHAGRLVMRLTRPLRRPWLETAAAVAFLLTCAVLIWSVATNRLYRFPRGERLGWTWSRSSVPGEEMMAKVGALPPSTRLFNTLGVGGYLIAEPELHGRVFIDGRLEVMGEEVFDEYERLSASADAFEAGAAKWGFAAALLTPRIRSHFLLAIDLPATGRWVPVEASLTGILLLEKSLQEELAWPPFTKERYRDRLAGEGLDPDAARPRELGVLDVLDDAHLPLDASRVACALSWFDLAADLCRVSLARDPGYANARSNLIQMLMAQGRFEDARSEVEPAMARHPDHFGIHAQAADIYAELGDRAAHAAQVELMRRRFAGHEDLPAFIYRQLQRKHR